mgnify:CR=1 FL=1
MSVNKEAHARTDKQRLSQSQGAEQGFPGAAPVTPPMWRDSERRPLLSAARCAVDQPKLTRELGRAKLRPRVNHRSNSSLVPPSAKVPVT